MATATYRYVAVDRNSGERVEGKMRAQSDKAVASSLEASGFLVGPVLRANGPDEMLAQFSELFRAGDGPRVKTVDLAMVTKQLEVLLRSGLSPADALDAAVDAAPNERFERLLRELADRVRQGMTLPEALAQYRTFSESYKAWVASAHETGRLADAMADLYTQLSQQAKIENEVRAATAYPKWSAAVSLLLALAMVRWLVPQFASMLAAFGGELPGPTQFLVTLNDHFLWIVALVIAGILGVKVTRNRLADNLEVGPRVDQIVYRLPVFGGLIHRQVVFRWCSTMAGLLSAGVHIDRALDIAGRASGSRWLRAETSEIIRRVVDGQPLHAAIEPVQVFPKMVTAVTETGERTGRSVEMLNAAANAQAQQVDAIVGQLGKAIETISMLVVLFVIGGIVAALWLPILELTTSAAQSGF